MSSQLGNNLCRPVNKIASRVVKGAMVKKKGAFFCGKNGAINIFRQMQGFHVDSDKLRHPTFSDNQRVFALIRTNSTQELLAAMQQSRKYVPLSIHLSGVPC